MAGPQPAPLWAETQSAGLCPQLPMARESLDGRIEGRLASPSSSFGVPRLPLDVEQKGDV